MSPQLAPWHRRHPGCITGSVYAGAPSERIPLVRTMSEAGLTVHVDVIDDGHGGDRGIDMAGLRDIAAVVPEGNLEVHLIGSPDFVDERLRDILACAPTRVFLPWASFTNPRAGAVRTSGAGAWITVWDEWTGLGEPHWPAAPDGVLVMLIEPGTRDTAGIDRLAIVTACASGLPVAVDGGVTEQLAALCVSAGAQSMVVGRALLADTASAPDLERTK